ncbi:MAG: restriction endonuclease subunit S [Dysgonamonadaceae bacterium]|jgi:type I restriction enzyme S subunit|nr:restriction endonuclease subunit S [Dysgonamonadaceae bacterium]
MKAKSKKDGNFPNLRFGESEGEWEKIKIKDFGIIVTGNTPPTKDTDNYGSDYLWASPTDLGKSKYITDTKTMLSEKGFKKTRKLPKGSILVTCIGIIGKMGMAAEEMATNQQINSVIVNDNFDCNFVYYAISSQVSKYLSAVSQQVLPIISKSVFEELNNYSTNIKEQKKIGHFLTLLDERISTQIQIIEQLKSLMRGLNNNLKELYGNEIEISLQQLGTSYSGLLGKSAEDFGSGKPFITYMNVYKNIVVDESMVQYVNIDKNETQNKVQYGDVLFTVSSETPQEVGMSAVYLGNSDELYLNSFCFGYRPNDFDTLLPEYTPYLFSCKQFRKIAYPFAQGSTRFNLQKTDFLKKKFKTPTIQNQKKTSTALNALSEKLTIEQKLLSEYQKQKKYLLNQMFI